MCGSSRSSSARSSRSRTADFAPVISRKAKRTCRMAASSKIAKLQSRAREQNDDSARVTRFDGTCLTLGAYTRNYGAAGIEGPSRTCLCGQRTSAEIKLSSFGRARTGTRFEESPQARLVKIAHGRLAAWLDPFGMLPSQVFVNLPLKLGHGVGRVTD